MPNKTQPSNQTKLIAPVPHPAPRDATPTTRAPEIAVPVSLGRPVKKGSR